MGTHESAGGRYLALDAMRGIAALVVAAYHFRAMVIAEPASASSYLAVDFFFLLSGFVIARAYEPHFGQDMDGWRFLIVRSIRLYPLYAMGIVLGMMVATYTMVTYAAAGETPGRLALRAVMGFAMLPIPDGNESYFPLNPPAWSLFSEALVNLLFAVLLVRSRNWVAVLVLAVAGAVLAYALYRYGTIALGFGGALGSYGPVRALFGFTLGVLMFRMSVGRTRQVSWSVVAAMAVFAAVMLVGVGNAERRWLDLAAVAVIFPMLLAWCAWREAPPVLQPLCRLSGDVSYPIYALHYPLGLMFVPVAGRLGLGPNEMIVLFTAALPVAGWLAVKLYDAPVRRALGRLVERRGGTFPRTGR